MKHKGKEEFHFILLQLEKRPSTLQLQQRWPSMIVSSLRLQAHTCSYVLPLQFFEAVCTNICITISILLIYHLVSSLTYAMLKMMWEETFNDMPCSTENQECYYGVASPYKNLQISVSETKLIMGKAGRCLSITDLISTITLPYHRQLRKIWTLSMKGVVMCSFHCKNHGSHAINLSYFFSSTQIPHAVGAAYSLKMDRKRACAVTYFGDGGTSEVNM